MLDWEIHNFNLLFGLVFIGKVDSIVGQNSVSCVLSEELLKVKQLTRRRVAMTAISNDGLVRKANW